MGLGGRGAGGPRAGAEFVLGSPCRGAIWLAKVQGKRAAKGPPRLTDEPPVTAPDTSTRSRAALRGGLTRRTVVAGGLLALLISSAFTVVLLAIAELRRSTVLARHSEVVLAAANHLERLVIDMETGQRGFAITGDERFLEPWNNARQSFPLQAEALERMAAARSIEQGRRAGQIAQSGDSYIRDYSV